MQIYISKEGKPTGPFSEDHVRSMLSGGFASMSDHCWHEGLPAWVPLSEVLGLAAAAPMPVSNTAPYHVAARPHGGQHPGFWLRFAAHFIDTIVVYVAAFVAGIVIGLVMSFSGVSDRDILAGVGGIAGGLAGWLYYALMESSPKQATLGKMACGFIVTDSHGQRISFGRATGRYFGMIISALILGIGFLMCAWTGRKQCLHDMMADCLMVKK